MRSTPEAAHQSDFPWGRNNWGRWDNERGTLNLVDSPAMLRAVASVKTGTVVSCGRQLHTDLAAYYPEAGDSAFGHEMITAWKGHAEGDIQAASDQIRVQTHGLQVTHIDAISHFGHLGAGFEGRPFGDVVTLEQGAMHGGVEHLGVIATRAVLLDVPRSRGVPFLNPGDPVLPEDLEGILQDLSAGDALLVRTGRWEANRNRSDVQQHEALSGLHHECLPLINDADVGLLGTDGAGENFPSTLESCSRPVHIFSLTYLGMPIIHNLDLDSVADLCAAENRIHFMLVVAPLNMPATTGSPVNPVGIL